MNTLIPTPQYTLPNSEVNIHSTAADLEFTAKRLIVNGEPFWEFKIRAPIAVKEQDGQDSWAEETLRLTPQQACAVMCLYIDGGVEDDDVQAKLYEIAEPVFANVSRPFRIIP